MSTEIVPTFLRMMMHLLPTSNLRSPSVDWCTPLGRSWSSGTPLCLHCRSSRSSRGSSAPVGSWCCHVWCCRCMVVSSRRSMVGCRCLGVTSGLGILELLLGLLRVAVEEEVDHDIP